MKKIIKFISSMPLTGVLLFLTIFAVAYATYIEKDYGAINTKALIYNTWWFELLWILLSINLVFSIIFNKFIQKRKWSIFVYHFSFVIIILGAGVTRYFGYEGVMHIREGENSNTIVSSSTFVKVVASELEENYLYEEEVVFTPYLYNDFDQEFEIGEHNVAIEYSDFVVNAALELKAVENGKAIISLVLAGKVTPREDLFLEKGKSLNFEGTKFSFLDSDDENIVLEDHEIVFYVINGVLKMQSKPMLFLADMRSKIMDTLTPGVEYESNFRKVYNHNDQRFMLRDYLPSSELVVQSNPTKAEQYPFNALVLDVTIDDKKEKMYVLGRSEMINEPAIININGVDLEVSYGAQHIELPFKIHLNDFVLEKYSGSNSPSAYISEVTVLDNSNNELFSHDIFMNNVLNYEGYRFFQSSFDKDEKGTLLSVNYDYWGTLVTYLGYFLMILGIILALFTKSGYFMELIKTGASEVKKGANSIVVLIVFSLLFSTSSAFASADNESEIKIQAVDKEHAEAFGEILVLDMEGRIKPIHTYASELVRKISKTSNFHDLSTMQVFLGILTDPDQWENINFIKVAHPQLQKELQISGDYISFNLLTTANPSGQYKIGKLVSAAHSKKPTQRQKLDKELIKVDERVNLLYYIFSGEILKIFPVNQNGEMILTNRSEAMKLAGLDQKKFISEALLEYSKVLMDAQKTGQWEKANKNLKAIKDFQTNQAGDILPSETKVKVEVLYNKLNVFLNLAKLYGIIGMLLLILHLVKLFNTNLKWKAVFVSAQSLIVLLFLGHSLGLAVRWYISGHAPWSNGYESMIYVAWAASFAGLLFMKKSKISLAVTTVLASLILFVAGMSWMDPKITNLVPVLKSYWLVVHVAVITASYGFLALSALLGLLNLFIISLRNKANELRLTNTLTEISVVIKISLIIGLYMLTIGTFLGAIWANESWGRYWGWDPKESWALITILVYTFITHMRKIPNLNSVFALSFASFIGFSSVLMTYFGVNYLLSGLHSYGGGGQIYVPSFIYYVLIAILGLIVFAFISNRKFKKETEEA